jgi:hypothetical protein
MHQLALFFLFAAGCVAADDPAEIVRKSSNLDETNYQRARNYTFIQRSEERDVDSNGTVKKREIRTNEFMFLDGELYRRLIAKDDKPLSAEENAKEERKMQDALDKRRKLSPSERAKQDAKRQKERDDERKLFREIPNAFHFALLRSEKVAGRDTWVIQANPRPDYKPAFSDAKYLTKFKGILWIDKQTYQWSRIQAETVDNISFGLFLAKLDKGAVIDFEQSRVNDEVWLPKHISFGGSARITFKRFRKQQDIVFSNYRKFQSESTITVSQTP